MRFYNDEWRTRGRTPASIVSARGRRLTELMINHSGTVTVSTPIRVWTDKWCSGAWLDVNRLIEPRSAYDKLPDQPDRWSFHRGSTPKTSP